MKTKIILLFFALQFLGFSGAHAQYNYNYNRPVAEEYLRNEVYGEYGVVTTQSAIIVTRRLLSDISTAILNAFIEELGFDESINYTRDFRGTRGAIGIGYNRYLAPRWTLGVLGNYHGFRTTINFENGQTAFLKDNFYTLMLRTDYRWVNQPGVQLYSGLSLGGTWWKSGYEQPSVNVINNSFFNMQFTPLGIRVGKQIGGFVEFGLGANGLIAGGISGKF